MRAALSSEVVSSGAALPVAGPSRMRRVGRFLGYSALATGAVGLGGVGLVSVNISNEKLLPGPLQQAAVAAESLWRFLVTTRYVVPLIARWIFIEQVVTRFENPKKVDEYRETAHGHTARGILRLVRAQGGTYVKTGQHLCASPVLPKVYVETLRVLMDQAIIQPMRDTERTYREDFGVDIRSDFARFDETPIATASLAQVYRAHLKNADGSAGPEVAVKVQHRAVHRLFEVDLITMRAYYTMVAYLMPKFDMRFFADEVTRAFREELDFETELKNGVRARELFAGRKDFCVPAVVPERSSKRILTMHFEEGVRIDDVKQLDAIGLNKAALMTTLTEVFSDMMFKYGFVHCDPHPGNILVRKTEQEPGYQVVLLDHGTYQTLTGELLVNYREMWRSILANDEAGMRRATSAFGMDPKFYKFLSFIFTMTSNDTFAPRGGLSQGNNHNSEIPFALDASSSRNMEEHAEKMRKMLGLEDVSMDEQMKTIQQLPREMILLLKTSNLLRYVNQQMGNPVNRFRIMSRYAISNINEAHQLESPGLWTTISNKAREVKYGILAFVAPIRQLLQFFIYMWITPPAVEPK